MIGFKGSFMEIILSCGIAVLLLVIQLFIVQQKAKFPSFLILPSGKGGLGGILKALFLI